MTSPLDSPAFAAVRQALEIAVSNAVDLGGSDPVNDAEVFLLSLRMQGFVVRPLDGPPENFVHPAVARRLGLNPQPEN
jgi:hypothetical protein